MGEEAEEAEVEAEVEAKAEVEAAAEPAPDDLVRCPYCHLVEPDHADTCRCHVCGGPKGEHIPDCADAEWHADLPRRQAALKAAMEEEEAALLKQARAQQAQSAERHYAHDLLDVLLDGIPIVESAAHRFVGIYASLRDRLYGSNPKTRWKHAQKTMLVGRVERDREHFMLAIRPQFDLKLESLMLLWSGESLDDLFVLGVTVGDRIIFNDYHGVPASCFGEGGTHHDTVKGGAGVIEAGLEFHLQLRSKKPGTVTAVLTGVKPAPWPRASSRFL